MLDFELPAALLQNLTLITSNSYLKNKKSQSMMCTFKKWPKNAEIPVQLLNFRKKLALL